MLPLKSRHMVRGRHQFMYAHTYYTMYVHTNRLVVEATCMYVHACVLIYMYVDITLEI